MDDILLYMYICIYREIVLPSTRKIVSFYWNGLYTRALLVRAACTVGVVYNKCFIIYIASLLYMKEIFFYTYWNIDIGFCWFDLIVLIECFVAMNPLHTNTHYCVQIYWELVLILCVRRLCALIYLFLYWSVGVYAQYKNKV